MNIKLMKKIILSLEEIWNTPNNMLEEITRVSWMQYHELRREIEGEED